MSEQRDDTSRRSSIQSLQSLGAQSSGARSAGIQSEQSLQSIHSAQSAQNDWRANLPAPEIDITRTPYFVHCAHPGGPHLDAILHVLASIAILVQDIRATLASLHQLDPGQNLELRTTYGEEIKQILANQTMVNKLKDFTRVWIGAATGNKMAKNRANKQLGTLANATFQAYKLGLQDEWDNDNLEDDMKELIRLLKLIEQNQALKEDLHLAMAKSVGTSSATGNDDANEGPSTTTASNTRVRGSSRGQGGRSRGARGASQSTRGRQATPVVSGGDASHSTRDADTGEPSRKRARRIVSDSDDNEASDVNEGDLEE